MKFFVAMVILLSCGQVLAHNENVVANQQARLNNQENEIQRLKQSLQDQQSLIDRLQYRLDNQGGDLSRSSCRLLTKVENLEKGPWSRGSNAICNSNEVAISGACKITSSGWSGGTSSQHYPIMLKSSGFYSPSNIARGWYCSWSALDRVNNARLEATAQCCKVK